MSDAERMPEELIDAYDPPEYIYHVCETVFAVPSLMVTMQE